MPAFGGHPRQNPPLAFVACLVEIMSHRGILETISTATVEQVLLDSVPGRASRPYGSIVGPRRALCRPSSGS